MFLRALYRETPLSNENRWLPEVPFAVRSAKGAPVLVRSAMIRAR